MKIFSKRVILPIICLGFAGASLHYSIDRSVISAGQVAASATDFSEYPVNVVRGWPDADLIKAAPVGGELKFACSYFSGELIGVGFVVAEGEGLTLVGPNISSDQKAISACPEA